MLNILKVKGFDMKNLYEHRFFSGLFSWKNGRRNWPKNWEDEVSSVRVEACRCEEDPLGYRAVFLFDGECAVPQGGNSFVVGASFLEQRQRNLRKSGYKTPMTHRAIALIENKLGQGLSASAA